MLIAKPMLQGILQNRNKETVLPGLPKDVTLSSKKLLRLQQHRSKKSFRRSNTLQRKRGSRISYSRRFTMRKGRGLSRNLFLPYG